MHVRTRRELGDVYNPVLTDSDRQWLNSELILAESPYRFVAKPVTKLAVPNLEATAIKTESLKVVRQFNTPDPNHNVKRMVCFMTQGSALQQQNYGYTNEDTVY